MDGPSRVSAPGPQASVRPRDGVVIVVGPSYFSSGLFKVKGSMVGNLSYTLSGFKGFMVGKSSYTLSGLSVVAGIVFNKLSTDFGSRPPHK